MSSLVLGLLFGALAVAAVLIGAWLVLTLRQKWPEIVPALLAVAAGGFLYVALADLVPELHERVSLSVIRYQILPLLLGGAFIWAVGYVGS